MTDKAEKKLKQAEKKEKEAAAESERAKQAREQMAQEINERVKQEAEEMKFKYRGKIIALMVLIGTSAAYHIISYLFAIHFFG